MIVTLLKLGISYPPDLHAKHILGMYLNQSIKLKSTAYFVGVEYFAIACGTNEGKLFFN